MSADTLPTFIVIGAAKAGTTALYWYLSEHPEVFMSPVKETNYFAFGANESGELEYGNPELHKFPIQTWDEYRGLFIDAGDATAVGEASPIYIESPSTARKIKTALGDVQIICGLRNPVDRAYSDYQMYLRSRGLEFHAEEVLGPDPAWARPDSHWITIGRYHEMLSRYLEVFPRELLHVYLFEDMRRSTNEIVSDVYRFVGADPSFQPDLETPHNVGGVPSRRSVERILTSRRLRALVEPVIPPAAKKLARRLRTANLDPAPALPAELRSRILDDYAEDISRTEKMLGVDLSTWLKVN